jgi:dTDP-4-dehydrorhamnose reductase
MRVLICGASGLLGHTLFRRWTSRKDWNVVGTYNSYPVKNLKHLDLLDKGAAASLIADVRPEAVVVPASNPFVDYLEKNEEEARALNINATLNVARAAIDA